MSLFIVNVVYASLIVPVVIRVVVVILSLSVAWFMLQWVKERWFVVVFVLTFIGGILILFIYVASVAHNEVLAWNVASITIPLPMRVYVYFIGGIFYCSDITPFDFAESEWYFRLEYRSLTLFFIVYLLVVLYLVVEVVGVFGGCVRRMYVTKIFPHIPYSRSKSMAYRILYWWMVTCSRMCSCVYWRKYYYTTKGSNNSSTILYCMVARYCTRGYIPRTSYYKCREDNKSRDNSIYLVRGNILLFILLEVLP